MKLMDRFFFPDEEFEENTPQPQEASDLDLEELKRLSDPEGYLSPEEDAYEAFTVSEPVIPESFPMQEEPDISIRFPKSEEPAEEEDLQLPTLQMPNPEIPIDPDLLLSMEETARIPELSDEELLASIEDTDLAPELSDEELLASIEDTDLAPELSDEELLASIEDTGPAPELSDEELLASIEDTDPAPELSDEELLASIEDADPTPELSDEELLASLEDTDPTSELSDEELLADLEETEADSEQREEAPPADAESESEEREEELLTADSEEPPPVGTEENLSLEKIISENLPENEREADVSRFFEVFDEEVPEEMPTQAEQEAPKGKLLHIRPEVVMIGIALVAAVVLGSTLLRALPYMFIDEDPESLLEYHSKLYATEPPTETYLEPTESPTEPENPTIPPERNPYDRFDFQYDRYNFLRLQNVASEAGVDVSAYQGNIDWNRAAKTGISFAMIRLGYRGYGSGKLVEDEYARRNLEGARNAGLKVGAYFFSQALNKKEVDEEIDYMLGILGETYLDMPIILDWEIPTDTARTAGKMDARTLTDLQLHFCDIMRSKGYQPMVYFNWHQSEDLYILHDMEEYPFWLALYQDRMTYPWRVEMWQYTDQGSVDGIPGPVDMNVYMPR